MNLNFTGKDMELTDAIKNYTSEKVNKLSKYFGDNFDGVATFKIEKNEQIAEIRITIDGGVFKAVTASKDLYFSIDKDIEILEGQIRKDKTKKDKQNMTDTIRIKNSNSDDDEIESEVVKRLYYSIKPQTIDDAMLILQGDSKNKFLPFINIDTNKVEIIYKLKDGKNFGICEPED